MQQANIGPIRTNIEELSELSINIDEDWTEIDDHLLALTLFSDLEYILLQGALLCRIRFLPIHKGSFIEGTIQKETLLRPTLPKFFRRDKYPDHHTWFQL